MASTVAKIFIAAIAATAVNALPQGSPAPPSPPAPPAPPVDNSQLIGELRLAPTALSRFQKLLTKDGALLAQEEVEKIVKFDYNNPQAAPGATGGAVKAANINNYPFSEGIQLSTVSGRLEACGINTFHVHPRADESFTCTKGQIRSAFVGENQFVSKGSPEVSVTLDANQGTFIPRGYVHYQFNPTCEVSEFLATLNSNDPGTIQLAQAITSMNGEIVSSVFGNPEALKGENLEEFRANIPANLAQDIEVCLAKCNIPKV